ncbi:uncharacterized protein LOC111136195 [Rhizophagus clarus]|uniref:Uncharacterized protein LOC111136195 n=1 Tax=Rhizophagus clarus TaxID=94130 RepID=A0A8H3LT03_9GLOM|nr:uncharacterized protein LOC111136195 [Rhizophagus clarus]
MPTVIVNVEYLSKSVFGWEGLPVDENINVDEFYQDSCYKCEIRRELWNKNITAYFSLTKTSEKEKIGLKCDVWETAKNYGKYITFKLKDNDYSNESTTKTKNAFELMRIASTLNYLPEFNLPKNSFDQLRIDLCELIKTNGCGWIGKDNANMIDYLIEQKAITLKNQNSLAPIVDEGKAAYIEILDANIWRPPIIVEEFKLLTRSLEESPYWEPINISQFCPNERMRRCRFIEKLKNAFLFKVGKYTYHHGNIQNSVYLWRIDNNSNEEELVNKHYKIRNNLKQTIQIYHTRAMRKEFIDTVELCIGKVEKARIRYIYSTWLEDSSASVNLVTQNIDDRVLLIFELGDPELITDLREINEGRIFKYDLFWEYALKYLEGIAQESILAVDERRHDIFQHLAVAISIRDFQNQVLKICPLNIPTPSLQWIRLQFWPKNPTHKSSLQFTCKLPIKFMVQTRQLRCDHEDAHYASALFRYQKEMAILLRENSWLVFMDDKHRCKVGEPGYPVAAVERGRQVIVSKNKTFQVADHDFTKCGIIPSVTMICDIPCTIEESFYKGQVYVADCNICKPLKSDEVDFSQVHSLPDPIPTIDKTSYKEFSEIYGTITTEQHRPSLKHQQKDKQTNKMGFSPNAQFTKNVGVVVECYECNRWRVLYSKTKLNSIEISNLERYIDTIQYVCGDSFNTLADTEVSNNNDDYESDNVNEIFEKVKINNSLTCNSPMEIPYYSSGLFEDICFQCGKIPEEGDEESNNQVNIEEGYYYYCNECYITVDSKKRRNRKVKLQQSKRRRTGA